MKILCAEALWDTDISEARLSYKPLISLIRNETRAKTAYFTFNTEAELDYLFKVFGEKKYDIFYIASHMESGKLYTGLKKDLSMDFRALCFKNRHYLKNKVLHVAACSSLGDTDIDYERLREDLGLSILSGYSLDTDTTVSSAMELLYFVGMLNEGGMPNFMKDLSTTYKSLATASGFRLYSKEYGIY